MLERYTDYDKDHCWQYDIRINNLDEDLKTAGFTPEYADALRVKDFSMGEVTGDKGKKELIEFIKRHEWLGNISLYTTHWFGCYHKGVLAGAILMNQPNAFSKLLGDDTRKLERLISRGACISWSPKNLASAFLMSSIKDMVDTTDYRLFTAYSDPYAKELGTIYQACNFYYLGKNSGGTKKYISPYSGKLVSDRVFRCRSYYKRYARDLQIEWQKNWSTGDKIHWENIPDKVEAELRAMSKSMQAESDMIILPPKHKYAYVLGQNKKETRRLRRQFEERNKIYKYPTERGE